MNKYEAGHYGGAEDSRAKQLAHDELGAVAGSGRDGGENVRAAVAEGEQGDSLIGVLLISYFVD